MKVLQTLGKYKRDNAEGVFAYRRLASSVWFESVIVRKRKAAWSFEIDNVAWQKLLTVLAQRTGPATYRLSPSDTADPPTTALIDTIRSAISPSPKAISGKRPPGWASYVAAVLEHEGSIDIYGGPGGAGVGLPICLSPDQER